MKGKIGTISNGALADILIVRKNPVDDINVLRNPTIVIQNGHVKVGKLQDFQTAAA